jgi:hypothetical protein
MQRRAPGREGGRSSPGRFVLGSFHPTVARKAVEDAQLGMRPLRLAPAERHSI